MGDEVVLLGDLDPVTVLLRSSPEAVYQACARCHEEAGDPYVLAAGCEVPPGTPEASLRSMLQYAEDAGKGE